MGKYDLTVASALVIHHVNQGSSKLVLCVCCVCCQLAIRESLCDIIMGC